ncbi:MAG TPA: PDZ domain-containing protein [Kofleriaceae bacterium]|nr:PDZ domain-containing protein [Kofleriaceae bacterium]
MHRLIGLLVLCVATPAAAGKASNPAFLGVGMDDSGSSGVRGAGPCVITAVEPGSPAAVAQLQPGDVFEKLDSTGISNCDALLALITSKTPGTVIQLEVRRHAVPLKVKAELLTRDEVLRRRLVGRALPVTELLRVDDRTTIDLSAFKRTTIVGWYPTSCAGCGEVLAAVGTWGRERTTRRAPVDVVAATADLNMHRPAADHLEALQLAQRALDIPLLAADYDIYAKFAIKDIDRVSFMVIDCRGTVAYVAPIAPNTDDTSAVLDELYAAAEQTARRMTR